MTQAGAATAPAEEGSADGDEDAPGHRHHDQGARAGAGAPSPSTPGPGRPGASLPVALFLLTVLSTSFVGALGQPEATFAWALQHLSTGLSFSLPLCGILVCHEAGHYLMARRHGVPVSLPYFIPLPLPPIGTMGALIGLRADVRSRNVLFDVAAGGPIAGLLVALPVLVVGLLRSPVGPLEPGSMIEGQSLLYLGIKYLITGHWLPGPIGGQLHDVKLHPMAFAGWVGLFITLINLLPIGQLDGGRLAAAYFGKGHERRSTIVHRCLPVVALLVAAYVTWQGMHGMTPRPFRAAVGQGVGAGAMWLMWAGALLVMRRVSGGVWHPEVGPAPLSPLRRRLCVALLLVEVLLFVPYFWREAT